eukprot:scaffold37041_cov55-Phaeocystis_antarctica.AAC.2
MEFRRVMTRALSRLRRTPPSNLLCRHHPGGASQPRKSGWLRVSSRYCITSPLHARIRTTCCTADRNAENAEGAPLLSSPVMTVVTTTTATGRRWQRQWLQGRRGWEPTAVLVRELD